MSSGNIYAATMSSDFWLWLKDLTNDSSHFRAKVNDPLFAIRPRAAPIYTARNIQGSILYIYI